MPGDSARTPVFLDHIVVATPDLDATAHAVEAATGVRLSPGGIHPDLGTRNLLASFGRGSYIEFIGLDADSASRGSAPRDSAPFRLDARTKAEVATWAAHVPDPDRTLDAARLKGFDFGSLHPGQRLTPEHELLRWRLTDIYAAEPSGVLPFIIDWGSSVSPARSVDAALHLERFDAVHPDPDFVHSALQAIGTDLDVATGPIGTLRLRVSGPGGTWSI